jgi:preprotein translocase subunit SecF
MFNIIQRRYWYFALSAFVIVPGLIAMIISLSRYGTIVKLGIDFTGGAIQELHFQKAVQPADVRQVFVNQGYGDTVVQTSTDEQTVIIRSKYLDDQAKAQVQAAVRDTIGPFDELRFEAVGPTIGSEVTQAATTAVIAASIVILTFIWFAFRKVPKPFRYGVCAIIAELHDVLVATGLFSLAGVLLGWEADALFLTALLTVIGFSVQDTIVVYDRIRENVPKRRGEDYETVVNRSLLETIHRSLATQLNAIFVLIAILLFGGATMKQFVAVLLVGMISGSYSSIFNAVPLLVVWEKGEVGNFFRRLLGRPQRAATY